MILKLQVKQGVELVNIIGMVLILFNMLQFLLFYEVSFVYLLQAEDYFNLTTSEPSIIVNDLIFWSQLITLFFDLIAGSSHDLLGRRLTIFIGFSVACFAFAV